mmetsp:Transcript_81081/g.262583  ORF Transcript_81081/g.262583 Transcript_81081/m.262583 type:complete len:414 (+) Transcript_81081:2180-3421(+)
MALCAAGSLRAELGRGPREDGDARAQHTRGPELEVDDLHDVQRVYAGGELVAAAQALDDGHSVLRYALADLGDGRVDLLLCKRRATRQLRRQRHEALHDHEHHHLPARFCIRRQAVESRPKSVRSPCAVCLRSHTYAELASSLPLRGHADVDARTLRTWEPWARLVCADVVVGRVPHDSPLQSPMRGTPTCEGQELAAGAEAAAAAFCSSAAAGLHFMFGQLDPGNLGHGPEARSGSNNVLNRSLAVFAVDAISAFVMVGLLVLSMSDITAYTSWLGQYAMGIYCGHGLWWTLESGTRLDTLHHENNSWSFCIKIRGITILPTLNQPIEYFSGEGVIQLWVIACYVGIIIAATGIPFHMVFMRCVSLAQDGWKWATARTASAKSEPGTPCCRCCCCLFCFRRQCATAMIRAAA